jgi:putative DNA primase/helicase
MAEVIKINSEHLANVFISTFRSKKGKLRYYRRQWFYWNGKQYVPVTDDDMRCYFSNIISEYFADLKGSKTPYIKDQDTILAESVLDRARAITHIPAEIETETFLNKPELGNMFLSTGSGILNISKVPFAPELILPLTPEFFNLRAVPHQIAWKAQPNTFLAFLKEILPDEDDQKLVQEIFGYCLLPSNKFQKFFIFLGEGANGKSVLLAVLRLLLGIDNVSMVGLEAIDPKRTFPIAAMVGKFANLCGDLEELDSVAEGMIKQLVAGDPIMIERKFKDPFYYIPTIKLISLTNSAPYFRDKSDGTFRRLIMLLFKRQFKPSEQRKELGTDDYWVNTGELPAILKWALDGLERLIQNGGFTESKNSLEAKQIHRAETNPARIYLNENVIVSPGAEMASSDLYDNYTEWAGRNGFKALASTTFSKEVKRFFHDAVLSENARTHHLKRTRFWSNIYFKPMLEGKIDIKLISNDET